MRLAAALRRVHALPRPAGIRDVSRNRALLVVRLAWMRFVDGPVDASQKSAQKALERRVRGKPQGLAYSQRGFRGMPGLVQATGEPGQRLRLDSGIDVQRQGLSIVRNRLRLPPVVVVKEAEFVVGACLVAVGGRPVQRSGERDQASALPTWLR